MNGCQTVSPSLTTGIQVSARRYKLTTSCWTVPYSRRLLPLEEGALVAEGALVDFDPNSRRLLPVEEGALVSEGALVDFDPNCRRLLAEPIVALAKKRTVNRLNFIVVMLRVENWIKSQEKRD